MLINSLVVATGQIAWTIGATRTSPDFVAHLQHVYQRLPRMKRYDWIMDNLNTHWSLEVCRLVARWCKVPFEPKQLPREAERRAFLGDPTHRHVFHFTPKHGSWLNQAELFFGVLQRRFLARGSFTSRTEFDAQLQRFLENRICRSRPSVPLDLYGRTVGSRHAIQPDASPTMSRSGLLQPASETVRTAVLSASTLPSTSGSA